MIGPRTRFRAGPDPVPGEGALGCGRTLDAPGAPCCQPAVRRAYRELCAHGQPERFAFEAAVTVYQWHHPEVETGAATGIVESWLLNGVRH